MNTINTKKTVKLFLRWREEKKAAQRAILASRARWAIKELKNLYQNETLLNKNIDRYK